MDDDFRNDSLLDGGVFGGLHDDEREDESFDPDEGDFAPEEEF